MCAGFLIFALSNIGWFGLDGFFTPDKSANESEKFQTMNDKHESKFSLFLYVNGPLQYAAIKDASLINERVPYVLFV